jgi:hypothetical protein
MAHRWRILDAPQFAGFVPMATAQGRGVGRYLRGNLLRSPDAPVPFPVASGNVRVHRLRVLPASPSGDRRVLVDFEVTGTGAPSAVATVDGRTRRLRLLEFVAPDALQAGVWYRDRPPIGAAARVDLLSETPDEPAPAPAVPVAGGEAEDEAQ